MHVNMVLLCYEITRIVLKKKSAPINLLPIKVHNVCFSPVTLKHQISGALLFFHLYFYINCQ